MSELTELYRKKLLEIYGNRTKDGKCIFCEKPLNKGEYCSCRKSSRVNNIYKKVFSKIDYLLNYDDLQSLLNKARTPQRFKGLEFSDFIIYFDEQAKVLKQVKDYANNGIEKYLNGENLLLIGNFGTGKTMLMSILCDELIYKYRFYCRYLNAVELIYKVKDTFNANSKSTTEEVLDKYRNPDFLFIDDIDKLNPTDYVKELIYGVVNYRTEKRLPIIVSANSNIETLDTKFFGEAIVSRLIENSKEIFFDFKNMRIDK